MGQPLSFVVLSTSLDSFKAIRTALGTCGRARLLAGGTDAEQVFEEIQRLKPSAAIVAIGSNPEQSIAFIKRLAAECPSTALISAGGDSSPDFILRSLRAGAREFLRLPVSADELKTVIDRIEEFCSRQVGAPRKKGRMISVFASKGGCGTSFLATNLAAATGASTVLVDLNLQAGDLPLYLGLDPKYSIADLVEQRSRLDSTLINSLVAPYSSNLALLAAPKEVDAADDIEAEHVFEVLERLRENFDWVVLDPQHTFDAITLQALDQSDEIVMVLTLDIPAIRSTQRALEIFDRLGYSRNKIRIIVNRWSKQIDLDLRQVEKFLGEPVVGFVPSDYQLAVTSINLGRPLVHSDSDSKVAQEIRRIGQKLAGGRVFVEEARPQRPFWSSLFGRQASKPQIECPTNVSLS